LEANNEFYISNRNGIWVSYDFGDHWQQKWLSNYFVPSFVLFENQSIIANIFSYQNGEPVNKGLIFSSDKGQSWVFCDGFQDLNKGLGIALKYSNNSLFAFPSYLGIYKSDNYGVSWSQKNNGYSAMAPSDFLFNDTNIFISCWGIFKSIDKGQNFNYLDLKSYDTGPIAMNSKGDIFVGDQGTGGTEKGIFRSTDGGQSWESLYNNQGPRAMVINKRDVLFIGSFSTDNGNSWHAPPSYIDAIGTNDDGDLFTFSWENPGTDNAGIWRSTDDGVTWNKIPTETFGFIDPTITNRGGRVVFNNFTKSAWFGPLANIDNSFRGIYKTTDNGRTWFSINLKAKGYDWYPSGSKVAVDSLGCWIASRGGEKFGIYRSCDNGVTWIREDTTGLPNEFGPIGVSPDGHIYVFGEYGGLYRSTKKYVSVPEKPRKQFDIFNSPNPFSDLTEIRVEINSPTEISLSIFDLMGRLVDKHNYGNNPSGEVTILFDGSNLPSGIYLYKISAGQESFNGAMQIIK
jgi:photosystem II stability/assembly factor-like uncharacterized protein